MIARFINRLMNQDKLTVSEIDRICSDFEEDWSWTSIEAIREIAEEGKLADENYAELFGELVQIDLEQRWILKCKELECVNSDDTRDLLAEAGFPSLDFYLTFPGTEKLSASIKDQLAECDVRCLARHGSGNIETHPNYSLRLDQYLPKVAVYSSRSKRKDPIPFFGDIKIGRQGVDDPAPVSINKKNGCKLVIAESGDATISRTQLTITAIAGRLARVTNGSRNRHFMIEDYGVLGPADGMYVKFPFTVSLGKIALLFVRE